MSEESKIDKRKFSAMESLINKGCIEEEFQVGDLSIRFKTLSYDEEGAAVGASMGNPYVVKAEYLARSIITINGQKIESKEEQTYLRELLGKFAYTYINELYDKYALLVDKIPKIVTQEDIAAPLVPGHPLDPSMRLS